MKYQFVIILLITICTFGYGGGNTTASKQDSIEFKPFTSPVLSGGIAISTGQPLKDVYGFGVFLQFKVPIQVKKKVLIEPVLIIDHFKKTVNPSTASMQLGWNAGVGASYIIDLKKNDVYFNPGIAFTYGKMIDMLVPNKILPNESITILKGKGLGVELAANFIKKRVLFGVSYMMYKPKVYYADEIIDGFTKFNQVHEVLSVDVPERLDLSRFKLTFGYYL